MMDIKPLHIFQIKKLKYYKKSKNTNDNGYGLSNVFEI